jgi:hypothetical protein
MGIIQKIAGKIKVIKRKILRKKKKSEVPTNVKPLKKKLKKIRKRGKTV